MMKCVIVFISAVLILSISGCSYVMDSVEGAITKRSSFPVDVKRAGNLLTVDWSKDAPSIDNEAFAGYEIYITEDADDEYAGYTLLLSGHSGNPGTAGYDASLQNESTRSVSFTYDVSSFSGDTYFFRVGVINWSEAKESDRQSNWKTENGYLYNWNASSSTVVEYYYPLKTDLDKISGSSMIRF